METKKLGLRAGECFEQTKCVFVLHGRSYPGFFCNFSLFLFRRSSTNIRKSYGRMQEFSNALNDRMSINLSTARNSKCIYYNIFGSFLLGQDVEILYYCVVSMMHAPQKRIFPSYTTENTLGEVF